MHAVKKPRKDAAMDRYYNFYTFKKNLIS